MGGPMPNLTSGKICCTAAAIMCEVECFRQCSLYSSSDSKSSTPSANSLASKNSSAISPSTNFGCRARCHLGALVIQSSCQLVLPLKTFMVHQERVMLEGCFRLDWTKRRENQVRSVRTDGGFAGLFPFALHREGRPEER